MKRNMWKVAKETRIPMAYDLTYGEAIQIKEKYESGETNAKFDAIITAFRYGFALAQRMEANKRKRGAA
ncbi:hypothetical protein [uncultured Merdimonas sp.]|uniref:hypothetical protein n=1 Tax=uncultured Merdimonas sp. TaxID=2023269 RepID=UPI00320A7127